MGAAGQFREPYGNLAAALGLTRSQSLTFGTGKVDDEKLERAVCEVFNFKPAEIVKQLDLLRPIYRKTTNYGHFGRVDDLDAILNTIAASGWKAAGEPQTLTVGPNAGKRVVYVRDPDGTTIEFMQLPVS